MRNSTRFLLLAGLLAATPGAGSASVGHSWISPGAVARAGSGGLVFVSDVTNNVVNIYSAKNPGPSVGQVAGLLSLPASLAVDAAGNLYVYNSRTNSILEFAPPYTGTPIRSYYDGLTGISSLIVDAIGTIYSANYYKIVEYPHGKPTAKTVSLPAAPTGMTIDGRGNLVSAFNGGGAAGVLRVTRTSQVPQNLLIPLEQSTADVLFDASGNLVVEDLDGGYISIFRPGATKPSATWSTGFVAPNHMAFAADRQTLYVSDRGNNTVKAFGYPSGQLLWQIGGFGYVGGVAVSPAAIPGGRNALTPFPAVAAMTRSRLPSEGCQRTRRG
jgi:hypothetical protein